MGLVHRANCAEGGGQATPNNRALADPNTVHTPQGARPAFLRMRQAGRVVLELRGKTIDARTRGVRRFTLVLSPLEIDFDRPLVVTTNGVEVFNGMVERDVTTLLRWAAADNDPTLLLGARLDAAVLGGPPPGDQTMP